MEPHKELDLTRVQAPPLDQGPQAYFDAALEFARANYADEMAYIGSTVFADVDPDMFFREYVWVVHATGFSAKAVGKFMPRLAEAYGPYGVLAGEDFETAFDRVRKVCNNPQKAKAVHKTAGLLRDAIEKDGWGKFRDESLSSPDLLQKLPYIGKITCFHLARNLGVLECVKPDLHLVRLAAHWGFSDCEALCRAVRPVGMPLGIVDLVLWYACSTFGTLSVRGGLR